MSGSAWEILLEGKRVSLVNVWTTNLFRTAGKWLRWSRNQKRKKKVRGIKFEPQKNSSLDEFTETK